MPSAVSPPAATPAATPATTPAATSATAPATSLEALRRAIGAIDSRRELQAAGREKDGLGQDRLALGVAAVDAALGGGLALGTLHEVGPLAESELAAATGFALALAARAAAAAPPGADMLVWVQQQQAVTALGRAYGPGLAAFGLDPGRIALVALPGTADALRVAEDALRCGIGTVLLELPEAPRRGDLTATRRLALAARAGGRLALLLGHRRGDRPAAAATRWRIAAAPGRAGATAFDLPLPGLVAELTKNRHGPSGRWSIAWDAHDRAFREAAHPFRLAAPAADRPPPPAQGGGRPAGDRRVA